MSDNSLVVIKKTLNSTEIMQRFASFMGEREAAYYINTVVLAVANNVTLQECNPNSIVYSALRAASLKLSCDPALGEAYLVPYGKNATFIPGYKGLRNLATRTNKYRYINAGRLRNGEQWVEDTLTGKCSIQGAPIDNTKIGWFAFFEMFNGYSKGIYMTTEEIHEHAEKYSKSYHNPKGLWRTDPESMEKKTVLRLLMVRWGDLGEAGNAFVEDEYVEGEYHDPVTGDEIEQQPQPKRSQAQNLSELGFDVPTNTETLKNIIDSEPALQSAMMGDDELQDLIPVEHDAEPLIPPAKAASSHDSIYQAVIAAGKSPDVFSAKSALAKCKTGYETPEKAIVWMTIYRGWRDIGAESKQAAAKANNGEIPE